LPIKEALIEMSRMGGTVLDKDMVAALFVAHRSGSLFTPKTWIDQPTPKPEEKS
jgi:hypothetical protein